MPKVNLRPLAELFRAHVLKILKKEGLIDEAFRTTIMRWMYTSGFSVSFSLEKLKYEGGDSSEIYPSKMTHGKNKKNQRAPPGDAPENIETVEIVRYDDG